MEELVQEFVDSRGVSMRVDRQQSVIRGVKLLGFESRNGRRYSAHALEQAASLYEGAKVNVNHPKGHPLAARDYQERLGLIRNVSLIAGGGLFGDLHFNPKHPIAEQLLWDAEHAPENVGFSHNVQARTARSADQVTVEAILKVQSVDLVADPATTRGLFESQPALRVVGGEPAASGETSPLAALTLAGLERERPDLARSIRESVASELHQLRGEVDRLQAIESVYQRRAAARRMLGEFGLPDPEAGTPAGKAVVSEAFFDSLLSAPSEHAMRQLVLERAELVRSASGWPAARLSAKPVSQEQWLIPPDRPAELDAAAFARSLS